MLARRVLTATAIVQVVVVTASCSETRDANDATQTADAGFDRSWDGVSRSPCSTGPAWDAAHSFAYDTEAYRALPRDTPECVPRCDSTGRAISNAYLRFALPSGACSVEGERCTMPVLRHCPCNPSQPPVDGMWCECHAGAWDCAIGSRARTLCTTCDAVDAGSD